MLTSRLVFCLFLASVCGLSLGCDEKPEPGVPTRPNDALPSKTISKTESLSEEPSPVELTPAAVTASKHFLSIQKELGARYLRLSVLPGGCQGFQHKLELDDTASAEDVIFAVDGVKVVLLKRQIEMLRGTRIDFLHEVEKEGFTVKNPNFEGESAKKWFALLEQDKTLK